MKMKMKMKKTRKQQRKRGGGQLNRIPVGPGSRNAAGKPAPGFSHAEALQEFRGKYARSAPTMFEKGSKSNANFNTHLGKLMGPGGIPRFVYRGIIKPSNYNELYPVALSMNTTGTLPSHIDVRQEMYNDLKTNWDFKYVCGHGVLAPYLPPAHVPERTYIRFNSPAGCLALISGEKTGLPPIMAFPETFSQYPAAFFNDMTTHFIENTGPLESFSSLEERAAASADPYPTNFCMKPWNTMSETIESTCMSPQQRIQSIYGPGEELTQMKITFSNNPMQVIMLGMYDLPIDPNYYMYVQSVAIDAAKHSKVFTSEEETIDEQKEQDSMHFKTDMLKVEDVTGAIVHVRNPNLAKDVIGRTLTLTEVFAKLPAVPDGKVRFLFINACRGAPTTMKNTGLMTNTAAANRPLEPRQRQELATRLRRASLGNVRYTDTAKKLHELVEARKYLQTAAAKANDPKRTEMQMLDTKVMYEDPELWGMGVSLVP